MEEPLRNLLVGRVDECRMLDEMARSVRAGGSRGLVLLGRPGIGKSALLNHLVTDTDGMYVLRAAGIEAESELPFAGLHQLFGSMTDRIGDEQWLDRATVLALSFMARRVEAAGVGLVIASREGASELPGLPSLTVRGLSAQHARELLQLVLPGPLDSIVRNQIVSETRGNPLALLGLPRGIVPAGLAGGFRFPDAIALPQRIEAGYRQRPHSLPDCARLFLLLAAADPVGDPTTLWAAASRLGLDSDAVTPALVSGLVAIDARVTFRHPLARTTIYRGAEIIQRRAVHDALAAVTGPDEYALLLAACAKADRHDPDPGDRRLLRLAGAGHRPYARHRSGQCTQQSLIVHWMLVCWVPHRERNPDGSPDEHAADAHGRAGPWRLRRCVELRPARTGTAR